MTPPSLSRQAFWSGTDSTYSNSTMFTPRPKTALTKVQGGNVSSTQLSALAQRGAVGKTPSASLTKMLTVGPAASVSPNDSVVEVGKEFKIAIQDERLRPDNAGLFHLQYDPNVLDLKGLVDAEIIQMNPAELPAASLAEAIVAFRVGASAPRAPTGGRKVTAKFIAKAPGVSPIRVALMNANGETTAGGPPDGKGIVRVRWENREWRSSNCSSPWPSSWCWRRSRFRWAGSLRRGPMKLSCVSICGECGRPSIPSRWSGIGTAMCSSAHCASRTSSHVKTSRASTGIRNRSRCC